MYPDLGVDPDPGDSDSGSYVIPDPEPGFSVQTRLQTIRSVKKCHLWKTQLKRLMERSFER